MKVFLVVFLVFLSLFSSGQRVFKKIAGDMCECFEEIELSGKSTDEKVESFASCALVVFNYNKRLSRLGYDVLVKEDQETIAKKTASYLYKNCPAFISFIGQIYCAPGDTVEANITDSSDCAILHNGTFIIQYRDRASIFKNSDNRQTVTDLEGNFISESEIIWVNDCEYILKPDISKDSEIYDFFGEGKEARVTILEIQNGKIKFRMQMDSLFYFGEMQYVE